MSEIWRLTAVEMARLIRARELSPREVLESHLARIAEVNPKVNAIVTLAGLGEALPGPLHGLPVAHKDLQPTRGIRTTWGSRIYCDFVPEEDSLLVERVRAAGAVCIGKTNTPEFGAGSQTYNEVFGVTRNPWDLTKTCGGSTGGGAVALACGMVPFADGSDLGGSLRNPASYCGVVGLRPTAGRVPAWPMTMAWAPLVVEGPMARTVSDLALFLSAMAGPDPRAPLSIAEPGARFAEPLGCEMKGARIAWWRDLGGVPVDRQVHDVTNAQRAVFESLGCVVEDAEPDFEGADAAFKTLRAWATATRMADLAKAHPDLIKDTIHWEIDYGLRLSGQDVGLAWTKHTEIYHRMRVFMERYDYFVLPVSQVPPFDVTMHYPVEVDGVRMETYIDWMKSCYYITMTGAPSLSVPCGFTQEGLPVGIQIVGRHRGEFELLQMGYAFEQAKNITARPPL